MAETKENYMLFFKLNIINYLAKMEFPKMAGAPRSGVKGGLDPALIDFSAKMPWRCKFLKVLT